MFKKFQRLPKIIEAVQFTEENKDKVYNSLTGQFAADFEDDKPILKVTTVHGDVAIVRLGDWIVKEPKLGHYYPIKNNIFKNDYCATCSELKKNMVTQIDNKRLDNKQKTTDNCGKCKKCLSDILDEYGIPVLATRMVVCPECGNKRCPKASDHNLKCTHSNSPGQKGTRLKEE